MSFASRDIGQQSQVELRDLNNMAGGLSPMQREKYRTSALTFDQSSALSLPSAPGPSSSMAAVSAGLSMPAMGPSLPGVILPRLAGDRPPEIKLPQVTMFQTVSLPAASSADPSPNTVSNAISNNPAPITSPITKPGAEISSNTSTPSAKAPESNVSPIAPSAPDKHPLEHAPTPPPTPSRSENSPEKPSMPESMASGLGSLMHDLRRSANPIVQFAKEIFQLVTGSIFAFLNFFFKPPVK